MNTIKTLSAKINKIYKELDVDKDIILKRNEDSVLRDFDKEMLAILRKNYSDIYFWPQGDVDLQYLKTLGQIEDISILERSLVAYTSFLKSTDVLEIIYIMDFIMS